MRRTWPAPADAADRAPPAGRERPAPQPRADLKILESRVYRGPNYWSYDKAVHLLVDLGSLEDFPTNLLPGFTDDLLALLPGLADHSCGVGRKGGFVERLRDGTWLGHVAEHVALQLQREAGGEQRRGKTRGAGRRGQYNVIYGYGDDQVGLAAGRLAVRLVNHLVEREPDFDFEAELERFILRAERTAFGPSTQAILDEAVARDIPFLRLNEHSLVQLGQGIYQQRIRATMTSKTSSLAVDVAGDKELTTRLLAAAGLPVPRSYPVRDVADAVAAAAYVTERVDVHKKKKKKNNRYLANPCSPMRVGKRRRLPPTGGRRRRDRPGRRGRGGTSRGTTPA